MLNRNQPGEERRNDLVYLEAVEGPSKEEENGTGEKE